MPSRKLPNIIITGTPGVGKTTHSQLLADLTPLEHFSINDIVKNKCCHTGFDEKFKSWIVDEDKLLDEIEGEVKQGGKIIDWHACDLFPESWIDLVVVLRTDNTVLFDRLTERNYDEEKVTENIDAEIMQVILEEARESYDAEIVIELRSDSAEDVDSNVERIKAWYEAWTKNNGGNETEAGDDESDQE
ncbi:P-loop containing nucleoside triphosphate hydrolase protein [Terfezia boudieri ATCC MYA-4762]|uniref:Adenylate kinase isoenzyme 6 homolog n=1 Tax=Terfezia boudieri ATCC MYA-4762 TaxID=1051890 RepID=A0A3N4LJ40_9PEZI|nr:P-loop containing nucleoside triphosphate hydrolase protein [Terfezia boudieri ATCC MYA-4762]